MGKNFTEYAFTDSVKKAQTRYGTRDSYARMEQAGDRYRLTARETLFIQARDSFYMATVARTAGLTCSFAAAKRDFSECSMIPPSAMQTSAATASTSAPATSRQTKRPL